jgi:hypothetical protein
MQIFQRLRHALIGRAQPKVTRLDSPDAQGARIDELPAFSLKTADLMRFDPQVRIGLGARNGLLMAAEVEVRGEDSRLAKWVQAQWDGLWHSAAHQLLRAKLYGFMPFEVVYRRAASGPFRGFVEVERLVDHHPKHVRLLVQGDKIVGFTSEKTGRVQPGDDVVPEGAGRGWGGRGSVGTTPPAHLGREGRSQRETLTPALSQRERERVGGADHIDIYAPRALVCTFDAECGNPYGCALLARAYPAWYEKWMPGGAKRTLRLRMIKDAYIGDIVWYPPDRRFELVNGTEVSFRDLAKEIIESRHSGGTLTLPLIRDSLGHKLVDYTPPQGVAGHTQIFRWKQDLDLEIWKALEVPPEIIQASTSGSGFSGRWIPFAIALSAVHQELAELIRCVDRDLLRPLAALNFGREAEYEIRPRSLVETYSRMFGTQERVRTPREREELSREEAKLE